MTISAQGLDFDDPAEETRFALMRGSAGTWRADRDAQLGMLGRLGLQPDHDFLEIGCGPLQAGAPLIRFLDPARYTGVDVSAERLDAARNAIARFGLENRNARLVHSTDFGLDSLAPASFDRIWCFQALIHFSQPLVERFMAAVATLLKPDGVCWFSARVVPGDEGFRTVGAWLEFPVTEAGEGFYRSSAAAVGLRCKGLGTLGEWGLPLERPGAKNWLFELKPAA